MLLRTIAGYIGYYTEYMIEVASRLPLWPRARLLALGLAGTLFWNTVEIACVEVCIQREQCFRSTLVVVGYLEVDGIHKLTRDKKE